MGNLFGNLGTEGLEEVQDRLGGYSAIETGIYTGNIKAFYAGESAKGAKNVTVIMAGGDFGNTEYRETVYITNTAGENYYLNKQDKTKKVTLPGYDTINSICLATIGKPLNEVSFEDKVMNIYDYEAKKEMPKSVPMAVEILGEEVSLAITKATENQTVKDQSGNYVPKDDGSTRDVNNIDKVFNTATKMTVSEATNGATAPAFWDAWDERNKGKTRDKTSKATGNGGNAGPPQGSGGNAAGGSPSAGKSLFGSKS